MGVGLGQRIAVLGNGAVRLGRGFHMGHWPIGRKVMALCLLLLSLLAATAATGLGGLWATQRSFVEFQALKAVNTHVAALRDAFLSMQVSAQAFQLHGKPESLEQLERATASARNILGTLLDQAERTRAHDDLATVAQSLDDYAVMFEDLVAIQADRNRILAEDVLARSEAMLTETQTLSQDLSGDLGAQDRLSRAVFDLRAGIGLADRYFATGDYAWVHESRRFIDRADAALWDLTDRLDPGPALERTQTLIATLKDYAQAFAEAWDLAGALDSLSADELAPLGNEIDTALRRAQGVLEEDMTALDRTAQATAHRAGWLAILLSGGAVFLGGLAGWFVGRAIAHPIRAIRDAMAAIVDGAKDTVVPGREREDEVGEMARAVEVFRTNAAEVERLQDERIAVDADRNAQDAARREALADRFETDVLALVEGVAEAASEVEDIFSAIASASRGVTETSGKAGETAAETANNVTTVAGATEELDASIQAISQDMREARDVARATAQRVAATNTTVTDLAEATGRIGEVVGLIAEIASQTNLLALNATIEAARAGEAGRGFSVVAAEVKTLAQQTAKATEDIRGQIGAVQSATQEAVGAMADISERIRHLSGISDGVSEAVDQQAGAVGEISRSASEVSTGTQTVAAAIVSVSSSADEAAQTLQKSLDTARGLLERSSTMRGKIGTFLEALRAA